MLKIFKKIQKQNKQKGITLVIAITTITLLLSISLSISNIVLRQIRITNTNNASKPAFFIADSALSCAFYYDIQVLPDTVDPAINLNENLQTAVFGNSDDNFKLDTIKCGNAVLGLSKTETISSPQTFLTTFDIDYSNMCAKVRVTRTEVSTRIESYGYNTTATDSGCDLSDINSRRLVERGLTITY
jgi:hypothetical protein